MSDPRMPSLSSFCAVVKPGMPRSTMKAVMPWGPASASVLAYTMSVEAEGPLVIHILEPLSKKAPSGWRSARRRMDTTSDPAPGSDIASEPMASPAMRSGRYRAFWAGEALRTSWLMHRLLCAP